MTPTLQELKALSDRATGEEWNAAFRAVADANAQPLPARGKEVEARVRDLEMALGPFAEAATLIPDDQEDFKIIAIVPGGHHAAAYHKIRDRITAGAFRKALAALSTGGDA